MPGPVRISEHNRCVAATVRRRLSSAEKTLLRRIEVTHITCARHCSGGPKARVHCATPRYCALKPPFFRLWSPADCSRDSSRVSLGRPQSPCVVYSIHGLVALLLRFSVVIGGAVEPPAAQTFERARLWHLHDVPPTRSSLLDRGAQDVICGAIFLGASGCRGVVRCFHMAWAWPAREKSRGRAGDAAEASIGRARPALLGCSTGAP